MAEVRNCTYNGGNRIICSVACEIAAELGASALNPDLALEQTWSVLQGDEACRWTISRRGTVSFPTPTIEIAMPPMAIETTIFVSLAVVGEMWANMTRVFTELRGPEHLREYILPRLHSSGLSFGRMLQRRNEGPDAPGLLSVFQSTNEICNRTGSLREDAGCLSGYVEECPFSGSPPEICMQFESFMNGICGSFDPGLRFAYDRMMTRGDGHCHWTIRKKGAGSEPAGMERPKQEDDSPMELLKKRLAKGEITPEAYVKLKLLLLEE